jgi:predicted  nucleic acid-binding Zn-ribbon protein
MTRAELDALAEEAKRQRIARARNNIVGHLDQLVYDAARGEAEAYALVDRLRAELAEKASALTAAHALVADLEKLVEGQRVDLRLASAQIAQAWSALTERAMEECPGGDALIDECRKADDEIDRLTTELAR